MRRERVGPHDSAGQRLVRRGVITLLWQPFRLPIAQCYLSQNVEAM